MKKAAVLSLLVLAGTPSLFSQYRHYSSDEQTLDYKSNFYRWGLYKFAKGDQKISITRMNKNGKVISVKTNLFNSDTLVESFVYSNGKGKEKFKILSSYRNRQLMGKKSYKNGELKYKTQNTYDGKYRTSFTKIDSKGSVLAKNENTFTEQEFDVQHLSYPMYRGKKLKSSKTYKKGGERQKNKWVYEYDSEGNRTITTLYDAKNDLKFTWDYTCKSEGELVEKKQEYLCKWQESKEGMLIEVNRKTSSKGKVRKTINKYDADTNLVAREVYLDDVILQKVSYDKRISKPVYWENYKKGVLRFKYEYIYADNGKVINTKSYKGNNVDKIYYEEKFTYEEGNLVAVENHSNGKLLRSYVISYNFLCRPEL